MHLIFNPFTTNENKTEIKSESNSWSKIYIKKEGLSKYHSTTDIKKKSGRHRKRCSTSLIKEMHTVTPSISHEVMGPDAVILVF